MQEDGKSSFWDFTRSEDVEPEGLIVRGFSLNISRSDLGIFISLVNI